MNWLRRLLSRARLERELDAELRFHFDQAVEDAMRNGATEAEARRAARLQWGGAGQIKEECRDARGAAWLTGALADARVAWRSARRNPAFAAAAVGALALGIGGNAAIFSVVNAVFLRPLPYPQPERLVFPTQARSGDPEGSVPPIEIGAWAKTGVFESLAGYNWERTADMTAPGRATVSVMHTNITTNLLHTLGVAPQLGRDFLPGECAKGSTRVALLSDSLWRSAYGGQAGVIGQTVWVDHTAHEVVGVLPRGFAFPGGKAAELLTPYATCPAGYATRRGGYMVPTGRLRPGVAVRQAQARLELATRQLVAARPDLNEFGPLRGLSSKNESWVTVLPLQERFSRNYRTLLGLMMGAAFCMLLIVCSNVANLFLARSAARAREVAVRAALGASRLRLLRLLLIESLMVSAGGGALGIGLAYAAAPALTFLLPKAIPLGATIDWRALAFIAAATLVAALLVGLAPALAAARVDLGSAMKDGAASSLRSGRGWLRGCFAVAQVALSLALLAGAGLLLRSFLNVARGDMGFEPRNVLSANFNLEGREIGNARRYDCFRKALASAAALPGVEAVGLAMAPPVTSGALMVSQFIAEANPRAGGNTKINTASPGYFRVERIPLLAGRAFADADAAGAPPVAILSRFAATRLFGGANPLGQRVNYAFHAKENLPWVTVVGVVGDVRHRTYDDGADWPAEIYFPVEQYNSTETTVLVRTRTDPDALALPLARAIQAADPEGKLPSVKRPDVMLSDSVAQRRQRAWLLGAFAGLSLLVAMVGIYGVVAYSVARRTQEIGVRMALGAQPRDVLRMVLGEGVKLALAGAAIGLALSLWLTRSLTSFLFGVTARDAATFAGAAALITAAICAASYLPARQATRVDPSSALRGE